MKRILVLADTHLPRKGRALRDEVLQAADTADLIAHLGDFTELEVANALERFAPLVAVHGNNDSQEIKARFPLELRMEVCGRRLAMTHGHVGGRSAQQAARAIMDADIVLYGHSHRAHLTQTDDTIFLNPGSPTERRFAPFTSYAILTIDGEIRAEIVRLT